MFTHTNSVPVSSPWSALETHSVIPAAFHPF